MAAGYFQRPRHIVLLRIAGRNAGAKEILWWPPALRFGLEGCSGSSGGGRVTRRGKTGEKLLDAMWRLRTSAANRQGPS